MNRQTLSNSPQQKSFEAVLSEAARRVIGNEPLASFCDWFPISIGPLMELGDDADLSRRMLLTLARRFWGGVPLPARQWRPQALPRVERNDRCYCGSGRKFKHCCSEFDSLPNLLDPEHALGLVLGSIPPEKLTAAVLRQIPAAALAAAAITIKRDTGNAAVVQLLEPLFEDTASLDARHEQVFDLLVDALYELGQEARRDDLVRRMSSSPDKTLAAAARCQRVAMLADRGEHDAAWKLLHESQRLSPNDPQLLHLELLTLLSQGRTQEAAMRAPLLAAHARRLGDPELAQGLLEIGRGGVEAAARLGQDDFDPVEEDQAWIDLLKLAPATLDAGRCRSLYVLERMPPLEGDTVEVLGFQPRKPLADIERRWRKRFPVEVPMLVELSGDADALLDEPQAVATFLGKHPDAWLSVQVLNDLLIATRLMVESSGTPAVLFAVSGLCAHTVRVCRALTEGDSAACRVWWGMMENRPFLRAVAQAIEFARECGELDRAYELMRWCLALNPNDNHGWRELVVQHCLAKDGAEDALQWLDRYPDDMPPAGHQRALALYLTGQHAAAETVLRAVHAESPRMVAALLPDTLDQPPDDEAPGMLLGGEEEAYYYRVAMRPVWVRTGALDWLRALKLPAQVAAARGKTAAKAKKASKAGAAAGKFVPVSGGFAPAKPPGAFSPTQDKRLRKQFPDYARVRGYLTSIAWSPGMVMPNIWLGPLLEMKQSAQPASAKAPTLTAINAMLNDVMGLYNQLNEVVLTHDPHNPPPDGMEDTDLRAWAAGFVQGAEQCASHWRSTGFAVESDKMPFKALYTLAAQAGTTHTAWRATNTDGQVLLTSLAPDPSAPRDLLASGLRPLWQVIAPIRQQRVRQQGQ